MSELKQILKTQGILGVIRHPHLIVKKLLSLPAYIKNKSLVYKKTLFLLDMPLHLRETDNTVTYHVSSEADDKLIDYAVRRETEDNMTKNAYVQEVKKRISAGDFYTATLHNGLISSIIFVSSRPKFELEGYNTYLNMNSEDAALYDIFTFERLRGQKLYSKLFNFTVNQCITRNKKRALLWVEDTNTIAIRAHAKQGMNHIIEKITFNYNHGKTSTERDKMELDSSELEKI